LDLSSQLVFLFLKVDKSITIKMAKGRGGKKPNMAKKKEKRTLASTASRAYQKGIC